VPSNYSSLTVTWYDETDSYTTTADITNDITSIPLFTDTGTGEVNEATIILRALQGRYITTGNIIDKRDRIHIECTDLGGNNYDRYFEVISFIPSQDKSQGGTLLTLECLGIEYHTQHINFTKPYYFQSGFNVAKDIVSIYNENKGSKQPSLISGNVAWNGTIGNDLPNYTYNNYDYALHEDTTYNRLLDLVDKFGASVDAGGALTFYELSFIATDKNGIRLRLRTAGDNTPTVTVENAKVTNPKTVGNQDGQIVMETGTNILSWGSAYHGTLPVDFSKYDSKLIEFAFRPEYNSSVSYAVNAKVKVTQSNGRGKHYKSKVANNQGNTPPPTVLSDSYWERIDMGDEFGDNIQYSAWTDDKNAVWAVMGSDPENNHAGNMMWDHNLVIWDENFFRTWVDVRAYSDAQLDALADNGASNEGYSYDLTRDGFPRGFRVLVINNASSYSTHTSSGSATGDLAGFTNQVVEWDGSKWITKYSFTSNNNNVQIAVIDESKMYEGTSFGSTPTWKDISTTMFANDCFHPFTSISNVAGVDLINGTPRSAQTDSTNFPDITKAGGTFTTNVNSALKFQWQWGNIADSIASHSTPTGSFYKRGAWACFRFPFPNCSYGITEGVGGIYGGGSSVKSTPSTKYEPSTLDIQNMHLTSDGLRGFNHGSSSEDLGQINAIAFMIKLKKISGADIDGNHKMRCFMIDTSDNVVYSDFEIEFSDHWEDMRLPISSFRVYRGRRPADGLERAFTLIPPKDLEVVNIFEWRNVKFIGIEWLAPYDKFGRYNPTASILDDENVSVTFETALGGEVELYIDSFRFIKPLLVTSGQDTSVNIQPAFMQRPDITVYHQLLNDAKAQLEIEKFQHKEFNLETSGDSVFDIDFGDAFYFKNSELVNESDGGTSNQIELVAKRIEYSIIKSPTSSGGLKRRIKGVKVFT
jgi:hypothetical protein